jgi:gliding motility-associated-like protein
VITDVNGNIDSSTAVVTVIDRVLPTVITQDITVQLDVNGQGAIIPGDIDNGSRDNCGVQSRILSQENFDCDDIQLSPITVTLTITDVNGNVNSATALVTVVDPIIPTQADAGIDQVICSDNSVMAANLPSIGSGQWFVVNGNGTFNDITSPTSTVSGLSIGRNTFEWVISTTGCNESRDTLVIQVDENPTPADAGDDQLICDFTSTTLNAVAPTVGLGQWSIGTNGSGNIVNPNSRNSSLNGLGIGRNQLVWTVTNGVCPSSSDIAIITVSNTPIIDAGPDLTIFRVDGAQLNVVSTPSEGVSYQWSPAFDIVSSSTIANPFARPERTTEFVVTVTDSLGCFTSDSVIVTVEGVLVIPTAFTPNNDGFNDSWEIKNLDGYASYKVSVFNGFGVKLFATSNYEPWDGRFNGEDLPVGSYYFVIELETFNGDNSVETGIVTIVK